MLSDPFEPGRIIGADFRIERRLKDGGFGSVFVARQLSTERLCALKILRIIPDPKFKSRFELECKVGARIQSDYVVRVLSAGWDKVTIDGEEREFPWLAMELLDGFDLEAVVVSDGPLSLADVAVILLQTCHALGRAHAAGIVHRDLKPENLFLARSMTANEERMVKILDFGIAKAISGSKSRTERIGTLGWLAPEQTDLNGVITPATDVWALGLIVFFLLTGKPYWRTCQADVELPLEAAFRELLVEPIEPASVRAAALATPVALPGWFDEWFGKCVTRGERFATASVALAAFQQGMTQTAQALSDKVAAPSSNHSQNATRPRRVSTNTALSLSVSPPSARRVAQTAAVVLRTRGPLIALVIAGLSGLALALIALANRSTTPLPSATGLLEIRAASADGGAIAGEGTVTIDGEAVCPKLPCATQALLDRSHAISVSIKGFELSEAHDVTVARDSPTVRTMIMVATRPPRERGSSVQATPAPASSSAVPSLVSSVVRGVPPPSASEPTRPHPAAPATTPQSLDTAIIDAAVKSALKSCTPFDLPADKGLVCTMFVEVKPDGTAIVTPSPTLATRPTGDCLKRTIEAKTFAHSVQGGAMNTQVYF